MASAPGSDQAAFAARLGLLVGSNVHLPATAPFRRILVACDGGQAGWDAVRWAAAFAKLSGAQLHALTVTSPAAPEVPAVQVRARGAGGAGAGAGTSAAPGTTGAAQPEYAVPAGADPQAVLRAATMLAGEAGVGCTTEAVSGQPGAAILKAVAARGADLLVIGSHNQAPGVFTGLGSAAHQALIGCNCSVLVARRRPPPACVLVGVDGSADSAAAAGMALWLSFVLRAGLEAVHVTPKPVAADPPRWWRRKNEPAVAAVVAGNGQAAAFRRMSGSPGTAVLTASHEAASPLVVMGSRGTGSASAAYAAYAMGALGATSSDVASRAECSVLLLKRPT